VQVYICTAMRKQKFRRVDSNCLVLFSKGTFARHSTSHVFLERKAESIRMYGNSLALLPRALLIGVGAFPLSSRTSITP
jgi:hypothetical protein